jgi:bifunctional non-homologous end joining protein LigD
VTDEPQLRFVVQKHSARTLHYDLRLERDGVFKSWAVPKGVPEEIGVKRLAIRVDDHALEFGDFEGEIPAGEYGAGHVEIWDRSTYESASWSDDELAFKFNGARLHGTYTLTRFPRGGEKAWLMFMRNTANKID